MNAREAAALRDALTKLEHGPGAGWRETLDGRQPGGAPTTLKERTRGVELWLESWITPAIAAVVARYYKPGARVRAASSPAVPLSAASLRARWWEGLERAAAEGPAWSGGYYQTLADQAISRLEEIERGGRS